MPVWEIPTPPVHCDCHLLRETPQQKWPPPWRDSVVNVWELAWLQQLAPVKPRLTVPILQFSFPRLGSSGASSVTGRGARGKAFCRLDGHLA